ncbi:MAG: M56 family metallopeptidase [Candidatus Cybelea sp.]
MIVTTLFNGLWQGAAIFAIAYAVSRVVSKQDSATRYALWFATLLALVIVPILTTASNTGSLLLAALRTHSTGTMHVSLLPAGPFVRHAGTWIEGAVPWTLCIWLLGVGVNVVRLGRSFLRIHQIRRNARVLGGADRGVFTSEEISVPIVAGFFDPVVVIPSALLAQLAPTDLQRIIEHERAHIRRKDPLSNLVQRVIEAGLFFNPWVRFAGACVSAERETACDDWVVEKIGDPGEYAACLATLAHAARPSRVPLLTPSAFQSRHALISRIERLSSTKPRRLRINVYALGVTIVIFIVTTLALQAFSPALALTPTHAGAQGLPAATTVAATCARPNSEALVVAAAQPDLPHGLKLHGAVNVVVTIAPSGHVTSATVLHSSGNAAIDGAVIDAARRSTYSPKIVNCSPVQGRYVFRAEFEPGASP